MPRGLKEKRLPPFWHPCFDLSEGIFLLVFCRRSFGSVRLKSQNPLWRYFCTFRDFSAEGFLVQTFKKPKALGICFALFVPFLPKVFWFGPF